MEARRDIKSIYIAYCIYTIHVAYISHYIYTICISFKHTILLIFPLDISRYCFVSNCWHVLKSSTTIYLSWVTNLFHLTFFSSCFPIKQHADHLLALTSLLNLWFTEVFARAMLVLDAFLLAACSGFILRVSQMLRAVTQAMPKLQREKGFTMCFAVLARVGCSHFRIHLVQNKLQKSEGWHLLGVLPAWDWDLLEQWVQIPEPWCFPRSSCTRLELLFCTAQVVSGHAVQYSFPCPQYPDAGFDACRVWS